MITGLYSSAETIWSFEPIVKLCLGPSKVPLGALTLAARSALRMSSSPSCSPASAVGLAWMRTAGRWLPWIDTNPTPDTCDSFCASTESARSATWFCGSTSELIASCRIGASAGFTLL